MSTYKISARQIKAARALLAWSQQRLAIEAQISVPTVARVEAQDTVELSGRRSTQIAICSALIAAGVVFIADHEGGPGVLLPN